MDNFASLRTPAAPLESTPLDAIKAQEIAQRDEQQRIQDKTTLGEKWGANAVLSTVGAADRFLENFRHTPDANWIGTPVADEAKLWTERGLEEYLPLLNKSVSKEHADVLYGEALAMRDAKETIGRMSTVGRLGIGLTDPGAFAVGAISAPAKGASLLTQIAWAGAEGAVQNAALSGLNMANDPTRGWKEFLGDTATGFALNGSLHGMFAGLRGEHAAVAEGIHKALNEPAFGADSLSSARVKKPGDSGMDVPEAPMGDAEQARMYDAEAEKDIKPAFLGIRRSLSARMAQSKAPVVRYVGRRLLAERVGYTNKNIAVEESAEQMSKRVHERLSAKWHSGLQAAWEKHRTESGLSAFDGGAFRQFRIEAGRYMHGATQDVSEHVKAAVAHANTVTKQMLEEARAAGVPGAEVVAGEPNWLPRMPSREGFEELFQNKKLHFDDVREQLIMPAIERGLRRRFNGQGDIHPELTAKVADAWLKRVRDRATVSDPSAFHHQMSLADVDGIEELLHEAGVDPQKAAILTDSLREKNDGKALHARFKSRVPMDEGYTAEITSRRTGETHTVSVADLLENDVGHLLERYTRDMSGWVALKSKLGVGNAVELDALRRQVVTEAEKAGDKPHDVGRVFDIGVNTTLGRSTELNPGGSASRAGRMVRDYSQLLYMNQVGFSMVAEVAPTMAYAGLRTSLRAMPGVLKTFKRLEDGSMATKEATMYAEMFAPGTDWSRNPVYLRNDALGETMWRKEGSAGKALNTLDNTQQVLKRVQSVISGMAPLNAFLQRWAARGSMMKLVKLANARKVSKAWVARLRNHGLTEEAQASIFDKLKDMKTVDDVADAWPTWDVETREALSAYMAIVTKRQVIEGMAGDSIELMHSAAGKPFTQFRRFMTSSYEGHLLNAMHMRDWQAFHMVVGSTMLAALGVGARSYLNTMNDPEAREKQLALWPLVKAGIQQSSYSSVIPMLVDTAIHDIGGYDPVFAYGRSSGLDSGIKGIPTLATAQRMWNVMGIPGRLLKGDEMSKKDVSNIYKLVWLNNATGFRNVGDWVAKQYPDTANN